MPTPKFLRQDVVHTLALFFSTILAITGGPLLLIEKATRLAKFFKNRQYCNAEVKRRAFEAFNVAYVVIMHGATRFAGMYYVIKRIAFLRTILKEISVHPPALKNATMTTVTKLAYSILRNTSF